MEIIMKDESKTIKISRRKSQKGSQRGSLERQKAKMNLFYIPALMLFAVVVLYPLLDGVRISFTRWNGYSQNFSYIGFNNYIKFFTDGKIWIAFRNTFIYGFGSTLFQNILGLGYALLINSAIRGRNLVRTVVYLPVMISPLIMGYVMYFFVQYDNGALNDIMIMLGQQPVDWMADGNRAVLIITLITTLQYVGIDMILYLAGLQGIPTMYYEAAAIDGVGAFTAFKYITLPMLRPAIFSVITLNVIGGLKLFDIVVALTNGGPGWASHSLSTLISNQYFKAQNAGYAAVIGLLSFVSIMLVSSLVMAFFSKREVEV